MPDTWVYDPHGNLCACMYGTGRKWRQKLEKEDLPAVKKAITAEFQPSVFVFCTNRYIDRDVELQLQRAVKAQYGWELRLFGQNELALLLDNRYQDIRERYLDIRIERHNWRSLLAACSVQRGSTISPRYKGEYEPELYVPRHLERMIDRWYRDTIAAINQEKREKTEKPLAQFLPIVDQAGTGKTTLVIHLATRYGQFCPVLLLPGSLTLRDRHTLEEEIVKAVGHPIEGRPYHAEPHHLCDLAQSQGRPLLIILDGIDKSRNPELLRENLVELLTMYQKRPLLVLVTCLVLPLTTVDNADATSTRLTAYEKQTLPPTPFKQRGSVCPFRWLCTWSWSASCSLWRGSGVLTGSRIARSCSKGAAKRSTLHRLRHRPAVPTLAPFVDAPPLPR